MSEEEGSAWRSAPRASTDVKEAYRVVTKGMEKVFSVFGRWMRSGGGHSWADGTEALGA